MTQRTNYKQGPDVGDNEVLRDRQGRVIDDRYVAGAVSDALHKARGRPSLSQHGESPLLRVRLSHELNDAVTRAADQSGKTRAEWVREALTEAAEGSGEARHPSSTRRS